MQLLNLYGINYHLVNNMFSKIKKYIIGFFVLSGGLLMAFLTGKSAGKKNEKVKNVKKNIKKTEKSIKTKKEIPKHQIDSLLN